MRIIDRIEEIVSQYSEHFDKIEEYFNRQNEHFKSLMNKSHDIIGKILKCHLIVENYLTNYLKSKFSDIKIGEVRLTFAQKAKLLPNNDLRIVFIKYGIIELNKIRNKFSHNLDATVSLDNLSEMLKVLSISRKGKSYVEPTEVIEDFTTIACTFLIVNPEKIDLLFKELFESLKNG